MHNFADDTHLYPNKKLGIDESAMNHVLQLLFQWLKQVFPT